MYYCMWYCFVVVECEAFKPESDAYKTGSRHAASTVKKQQHRRTYDVSKDAQFHAESGFHQRSLQRELLRRHSAVGEDLYCPMNGVRVGSDRHLPATNRGCVVQNTCVNLYRVCSDETLSLHSHSRRLQQTRCDTARPTPTRSPTDRRTSALDIATNSATHKSRVRRDRHHRAVVPQAAVNASSGKSRRTVVNNRPDLLCTWKDKDNDDWNYISPLSRSAADCSGPRHSSPQDDLHRQSADANEPVSATLPATTQSPHSVVSDGSPGSQYPVAPAASPVTVNSVVFTPPPCSFVSSSTTEVWPTTSSLPSRLLIIDSRSNPDSGYGSKIYRCQGTGLAVDPVTSHQEHLAGPVETGVNLLSRMCPSIPDVVVNQPPYQSGPVISAATLPRTQTACDYGMPSGHQLCQGVPTSSPPNLDLMTYSETNLVVSPRHSDRRQLRVPIELADENFVAEIGETFSPMSPLSVDSVDFVADRVSDFLLLSPTNNVSITTEAESYPDVPQTIGSQHDQADDERLYYSMNAVHDTDNQLLGNRNISSIIEDVQLTSTESESYPDTDNYHRLQVSAEGPFDDIHAAVDITEQVKDEVVHCHPACDAQRTGLQIGRCTTV